MVSEKTGLTPVQKTFYQENGYLILEGVFSQEECQRFVKHMEDPPHRPSAAGRVLSTG